MSAEGRELAPFVPPARPGLQSRVWREMTRFIFRYMANPALPAEVRRRRMDRLVGTIRVPRGTRVERVMAGRVPAEWIVPPGVETDAVLLYLHGGGYAAGSFVTHRVVAEKMAQLARVRALLRPTAWRRSTASPRRSKTSWPSTAGSSRSTAPIRRVWLWPATPPAAD